MNRNGHTNYGYDDEPPSEISIRNDKYPDSGPSTPTTSPSPTDSQRKNVTFQERKTSRTTIFVDSVNKRYGNSSPWILQNFCMTVKENTIYGLLGASGCGKTTALSCIIGLEKINSGELLICGYTPGTKESGVPGKRIGYMPQEIALNPEFTIRECMQYFGRIYGMSIGAVERRRKYLCDLLNLRKIKHELRGMSGGQKRRVSFAVALLHQPEILILDEPTVGVDPLLRQRIWQHLTELVAKNQTTVIITTHYIEETRQADCIGLMRNGRLMVEDSPPNLMEQHNCQLLEEIVLRLCLRDEKESGGDDADAVKDVNLPPVAITAPALDDTSNSTAVAYKNALNGEIANDDSNGGVVGIKMLRRLSIIAPAPKPKTQTFGVARSHEEKKQIRAENWTSTINYRTRWFDRMGSLFAKNILVLLRSIPFLLFLFVLPATQIIMVCLTLATDPKDLPYGVINHEVPTGLNKGDDCWYEDDLCVIANFSCRFINNMDRSIVDLRLYQTEAEALEDIKLGHIWGYVSIPQNFSENMFERIQGGIEKAFVNETVIGSQLTFKMDLSNTQIALQLQRVFLEGFRKMVTQLLDSCDDSAKGKDLPLVFEEPVYGSAEISLTHFITPGVTTAFLSFLSSLTCGLAYIVEKKDGMVHRIRVAGVRRLEIMLGHMCTQFGVMVVQAIIAFFVMFLIFHIPQNGSLILAFILTLFNSVAGMSLGFLAASLCDEEKYAMMMAIGAILPCFLVSGSIFPFEALPKLFQYVGYLVPGTLPGNALRAILLRGWGLEHFEVWLGFVSSTAWTAVYWSFTIAYHMITG